MSHKVSHYVRSGLEDSKIAIKKDRKKFGVLVLWNFAAIVGKLFFLSYPIFALGEYHLAHQINKTGQYKLIEALNDSTQPKKYLYALQYSLFFQTLLIAGLILCGGLSYGLIQLGYYFDDIFSISRYYGVFITQIASAVFIILFILSLHFFLTPVAYLMQANSEMNLSLALKESIKIMQGKGKAKLFSTTLYYLGSFAYKSVIILAIGYVFFITSSTGWFILITIILSFIVLSIFTRVMLAYRLALTRLFNDLVEEREYIQLEEDTIPLMDKTRKLDLIMRLFNDTTEEVDQNQESHEEVQNPVEVN